MIELLTLGLDRREAKSQLDDVIEFSELEEFIDAPMRTYSTGMAMRLLSRRRSAWIPTFFSSTRRSPSATNVSPPSARLWLDEFRKRGKTTIIVTHSSSIVADKLRRRAVAGERPRGGFRRIRSRRPRVRASDDGKAGCRNGDSGPTPTASRWRVRSPKVIARASPGCCRCCACRSSDTCAKPARSKADTKTAGPTATSSSRSIRCRTCSAWTVRATVPAGMPAGSVVSRRRRWHPRHERPRCTGRNRPAVRAPSRQRNAGQGAHRYVRNRKPSRPRHQRRSARRRSPRRRNRLRALGEHDDSNGNRQYLRGYRAAWDLFPGALFGARGHPRPRAADDARDRRNVLRNRRRARITFNANNIQGSIPGLIDGIRTSVWASFTGIFFAILLKLRYALAREENPVTGDKSDVEVLVDELQAIKRSIAVDDDLSSISEIKLVRSDLNYRLDELQRTQAEFHRTHGRARPASAMKRLGLRLHADEEHWIPLADLMTGLMLLFLLIALAYMAQVELQQSKPKNALADYEQRRTLSRARSRCRISRPTLPAGGRSSIRTG